MITLGVNRSHKITMWHNNEHVLYLFRQVKNNYAYISNCYLRIKGKYDKVIETFFNVSGPEGGVPYVNIQMEGIIFILFFSWSFSPLHNDNDIYARVLSMQKNLSNSSCDLYLFGRGPNYGLIKGRTQTSSWTWSYYWGPIKSMVNEAPKYHPPRATRHPPTEKGFWKLRKTKRATS